MKVMSTVIIDAFNNQEGFKFFSSVMRQNLRELMQLRFGQNGSLVVDGC